MTSETYQDLSFDRTGKSGGKRPIRPKLLKLTDVTMPHRSRKKTKVKCKDRSQSTVRDRIYDDPAYTDDISHLANPLRRSSVSVGGSTGGKGDAAQHTGGSLGKRPKLSAKQQAKQSGSYEQDGSSSSDNGPPDVGKGNRGRSLERPERTEKSPKKRDTKRDRSSKQKRNLSLDNTQPGRRSLERGEGASKLASADRSYRGLKIKSSGAPKPSPDMENWPEYAPPEASKQGNDEAFSARGKDSTKMQIGRKFLKGEIGIKSFNYYLLKEGLKSSKKFVEKQRNSLTGGLGSKKHISRSEENIYEEIFFKDRPSDTEEPQSQSQPPPHSIYPDCELCMQQCTKEDCEYCLQDNFKSKQQFGSLGRNDNRSSFTSAAKQQRQAQQQQQHQQQTTPAAHILEFQSYNPNNPGVYKIETTPVAITGEYNPILQFQQQPQETHKQVPQQLQQHMPSHHSLQQMQLQSHYQQPTLPPIPQPRRTSRMPAANGAGAGSVGGGTATNIQPPLAAFIVGTGIGGSATIGLRVNNTKSSSSSDSLHHKYNTMARLEATSSADQYHQPPPPNYRMYRLGGHLGGSQILPEPSYEPKIYKSDSKVSIISEFSVRSSDNTSNRNFRCGEVSDSSLGDSMFSYSTQQRKYFGSSESCRFAFECRRCSLDGEKCSFSDTCRYECRNCDCSSSYFSSDFDDLNYGRKSSSSQKSYEYFNDSNLDLKQNKYAQDFFKHVNDVKRSIYQAELQRSSGADSNQSGGNGNQPQQQHHGHSGRYQQGRGSPFRNIKVPPAPPPSMYSTLPLAKDRVAARPSIKHNQPVPAPRSTMQQQNFSSLRKQSQHHQQHQQPAPLPRDRGEYASLDRVVTHRTGTVPLSTATTGAIPKGTPLSQKLHKLPTNVPTAGAANQSNVNTTDKHQSPQPSPKLIKVKEKPKQQAPFEQIPASVTMETDRKIITTPRKQSGADAKPKKKATTTAKAMDPHDDVTDGRGDGSTLTRQKVTQSEVTQPPPPPTLTNDKQANDLQAPKKDENDTQPPGCRLGNIEASGGRSPIPAIVEKPRSNEQQQIENVHNDKAFNVTTAGEVGPDKGGTDTDIGTGTIAATTTSPDEDDDVFYDARSEDSLSVGPRRRPKDQTLCGSSTITSPPTSPRNGTTAAAANPRKNTTTSAGAVTSPKVQATPAKPAKSTISCDTCCQLEESPISTRNASPVGSIVASTPSTSNMNSPHKLCVEYAPDKQVPQVAKPTSTGESSHQKSAHNPQVNETIITTNGNTNSGDLLQPSTESASGSANSAAQHQPPVVATVAPTPSTTTTATTTDDSTTNTIVVAASNAPATASTTTSAVETSPVTISVTTSSAEEAVAGNKATSELSRDSDITGVAAPVTTNSELTPETGGNSSQKRPKLARQEYSCIDSTSEAASTDDSHLTRESRHSSNDRSSVPDKIDISNLPLPALPPKKRRSRSRPISSAYPAPSSITTTPEDNVKDPTHSERTPYQQYAARRRESLEASTRSFNEKLEARKMHYHSLSQTSAASTSQKPTYLFGENRTAKKSGDEIFLNKSGWVQVNTKRINDENSPGSHNRKANYLRHDSFQNGGIGAGNLKNTIRVIQIDNTGRDKPVYAVPKISGSKIEELISRNEARRNTSATRTYMKPGYKIVDPQIASILNERPGFLPVKTYLDSESPPPVTPILSPPPAFQDSKAKFERTDAAVRVQITTSSNPVKYDANKVVKGGMVFSRSFEYDARKPPKDSYVETFSRSFDCNLSDKPPPQRDRSPNFSTLTGCSPNYLTKKENPHNKSRDNSPKYQQNLTTAYLNTSVKEAPPMYSQPRKLEKAKSQFDRNGRSRKAQFSSRLQTSAGGVGMVAPPSIANMSRFRSFDTSISQRLNSCDSGARSDLSNDELDNEEDESTEFLTTNYHNISPYKQQRQRSLTPDRNDSHSSSSSLRKQRSITPESRSLTPEDRRKKGSQGSLGSRQNSGSRSNTLERNKKYEDKSLSASRSSSSSSYSGREHDAPPSTSAHRRSNARNAKAAEDHRIRRSRSLQLTERSPNRSHKMVVCVGQALPPNQPPIYHQSSIRSTVNSGFPPTIRTTTNQQTHQQILITNSNSNRNLRSSEIDKSRSFDFDYITYSNQNVPTRLDFVDKSRSFDEDYREPSNNNGSANSSMRYLQTTDPGLRKVRKSSPIPSPQSSGTSSSTTLGPRQTSPQNYGTRLCDHELTYDMLRRSLDRSPIMDFSRDYDIPQSMKNRETINAGGNSELNFLSSSERIYDHPTTKRPNQSPSDSNYSLDRLHNSRDSLTPDSANEFKTLVTSDERLRSEYLYRQQQQRAHQGTNRGSSCTASTCDFWPHCGASFNQIVSKAKANKPHQLYSHHQHHQQQQQQQQHRRHLHKQLSLQHQQQPQIQEQLKRQITVSAEVSNNCGGGATGLIRSDSRKSSSVNKTAVNGFESASRGRVANGIGVDVRNEQKRDSGVTVKSNVSKTSIRVEGRPTNRPTVKPFATSSVSIFLGDCEMPITRERQHGSPTTSGTSSAGSGGRYGHSPSGDWTAVDTIRSRASSNNTSKKQNCTLAVIAHAGSTETPASHERLRSVSLPNILNLSEPRFETTTTNDGVSVIGISSSSDIKRDLFPNNLQTQIRAVSSPSLSDHPSDVNLRNSNQTEYNSHQHNSDTHQHQLTPSTNTVIVNGHHASTSSAVSTGVLQKFKRTFSNFNKPSNGGNNSSNSSNSSSGMNAIGTVQNQQTSTAHLQQIPVPVLEMGDNTTKYRFGPLIWRSSKERRKTKYNRRDKCNSGDSGIQIELENDEAFAGMEINGATLTSTPKARIRRANSAKATSSPTSALTAKAKALKKMESYDSRMAPASLPARRSLSQPSGLDRVTRTDLDESDTDSVSSHPDSHEVQHRPMYAEVLHNFTPASQQELALERGNLVEILRKEVGPWWYGRIKNDAVIETLFEPQLGWFPKDFVRVIQYPESDGTFISRQRKVTSPSLDDTLVATTCSISPNNVTTIVVDHPIPDASPKKTEQEAVYLRNNAVKELLETEINYVKLLGSLCTGYLPAMRKRIDIFSTESLNLIFSNIENIWKFQQNFLDSLRRGIELDRIAQVFLQHQSGFLVYSTYCNSYPRALIELETYSRSKDAKTVLENCRQAENLPELPLSAHLLAPIQRICRYPLHLAELIKSSYSCGTENGEVIDEIDASLLDIVDSKEILEAALKAMRKVTEAVNEGKRHSENLARHQSSFENFTGPPLHFHSTRYFTQIDATRVSPNLWNNTYTLFLFDHQLIYCKKDILKRNHFIYKGRIFLDNCRILNLPDGKIFGATVKNALRIYCESRNKWFDFSFRSANRKKRFLSTLALERQFCGKNLFISELAGDEEDNLSDREYHSDYEAMTTTTVMTPNGESHYSSVQLNWKENVYDEKSLESPAKLQKYSDTLPKKSRQVNSKEGYEYNTGSLGRRRIGNWFRKSKSTNSTPNQSPTHNPSVIIFNSDSSSQSSPALGKAKSKDSSGSSS